MFKWLARQFNQGEQDPDSLASEKGIEAFIAALPVTMPARTVDALGEPFEQARSLGLGVAQLRRALKRLDERAQVTLQALGQEIFSDGRARQINESAWLALARYYRNVYAGYRACLDALPDRAEQSEAERGDAVLLAARAMAALGRHKALLRMRYRVVEPGYWENLHGLALWSATFGTTLIELYEESGYQSSVEREYLIALLYEVAPISNLLPPQLIALDALLRRLATHFQLAESFREGLPFVVDPGRDQAPRRWLKGLSPRPGQHFFGAGSAYGQLVGMRKQATATPEVPEWLAGTHLDRASWRGLLDLLVQHWSLDPPQRRQRRDRGEGEILVTHGVAQVRRMIAASEYARSGAQLSYEDNTPYDHKLFGRVRFGSVSEGAPTQPGEALATPMETLQKFELEGDRQMTERWLIADVSEQGMGAIAPKHAGWARVGMLLGLRRMDSLDWKVAVVRRLNRGPDGKLSIGMQTLDATTFCARLRFGSGDAANPWAAAGGTTDIFHDAILLRDAQGSSLLLEPGVLSSPGECMLSFERRWHPVRLIRSLESGYDYERAELALGAQTPP